MYFCKILSLQKYKHYKERFKWNIVEVYTINILQYISLQDQYVPLDCVSHSSCSGTDAGLQCTTVTNTISGAKCGGEHSSYWLQWDAQINFAFIYFSTPSSTLFLTPSLFLNHCHRPCPTLNVHHFFFINFLGEQFFVQTTTNTNIRISTHPSDSLTSNSIVNEPTALES